MNVKLSCIVRFFCAYIYENFRSSIACFSYRLFVILAKVGERLSLITVNLAMLEPRSAWLWSVIHESDGVCTHDHAG